MPILQDFRRKHEKMQEVQHGLLPQVRLQRQRPLSQGSGQQVPPLRRLFRKHGRLKRARHRFSLLTKPLSRCAKVTVKTHGFGPSFGFEFSDGTRVPMFIDTGAAQTSFPEDVLVRIGDQAGVQPLGTATAVGVHGKPPRAPRYPMDRLDISTYRLALSVSGVPRNFALLGMDVLPRFYFLVDGPGRELWFALRTDG